jgi:hypothetical protein
MKARLWISWGNGISDYDGLPDNYALSSARLSALAGGHAKVTLSDGTMFDYVSDDTEPMGYRTYN